MLREITQQTRLERRPPLPPPWRPAAPLPPPLPALQVPHGLCPRWHLVSITMMAVCSGNYPARSPSASVIPSTCCPCSLPAEGWLLPGPGRGAHTSGPRSPVQSRAYEHPPPPHLHQTVWKMLYTYICDSQPPTCVAGTNAGGK